MSFKQVKSRLKKEREVNTFRHSTSETRIALISQKPRVDLGQQPQGYSDYYEQLRGDGGLAGRCSQKKHSWKNQGMDLPEQDHVVTAPLDVPTATVSDLGRGISRYHWKWHCWIALYGKTCKLRLPLKSTKVEFEGLACNGDAAVQKAKQTLSLHCRGSSQDQLDLECGGGSWTGSHGYAIKSWWEQCPDKALSYPPLWRDLGQGAVATNPE